MDWRTRCFDCLGGIADETGANFNRPVPLANPAPDTTPAPAPLTITWADASKPAIKLTYTNAGQASAPGFWVNPTPNPSFIPKKGAFTATGNPGEWSAVIELQRNVSTVEVKVFGSEQLTKVKGAKPLATAKIWFKEADSPYDDPDIMTTPLPDLDGELGVPFLSEDRIAALSPKRQKVIRDFLPMVTPSTVGTPAFDHLQSKTSVEEQVALHEAMDPPRKFTTCGSVPSFLSGRFNEAKRDKRYKIGGLIGCFWAAHDSGSHTDDAPAWVTAEGGASPQPGDIFLITSLTTGPADINDRVPIEASGKDEHKDNAPYAKEAFTALHVGVIVDTDSGVVTAGGLPIWVVSNAGQGDQHEQKCLYTTLIVETDAKGWVLVGGRRLAGWVDIDNYTPWTA